MKKNVSYLSIVFYSNNRIIKMKTPVQFIFTVLLSIISITVFAQKIQKTDSLYGKPIGQISFLGLCVLGTDTIPCVQLEELIVSDKKRSPEEEAAYRRLKRNVIKVYPYAQRAIELINELDAVNASLTRRRDERKYRNYLEDQLKKQFAEEVKDLSISQGKILIKLIERGTNKTFYNIVREHKNWASAFVYHNIGRSYGYDLKEGYNPQNYSDLENIVSFLELNGVQYFGYRSYPESENLKNFELPNVDSVIKSKKKKNK
ncbi:MAG: DUF4294 domain-containing protein [Sphingobacteriales bacterium]|nr:MAG: DUF4294 domain-containing protein [Sphingobacteriales bacterium]